MLKVETFSGLNPFIYYCLICSCFPGIRHVGISTVIVAPYVYCKFKNKVPRIKGSGSEACQYKRVGVKYVLILATIQLQYNIRELVALLQHPLLLIWTVSLTLSALSYN